MYGDWQGRQGKEASSSSPTASDTAAAFPPGYFDQETYNY
jgi:hypothetical protein